MRENEIGNVEMKGKECMGKREERRMDADVMRRGIIGDKMLLNLRK